MEIRTTTVSGSAARSRCAVSMPSIFGLSESLEVSRRVKAALIYLAERDVD